MTSNEWEPFMSALRHSRVGYWIALASLLIAGRPSGASAQAAREAADATLRAACRLAVQTLEKGHPAPKSDWALSVIYWCDESGATALGKLWAATPADSASLEQLVLASSKLLDQRVYTGVLATARNSGALRAVRLAALRVLCAYISPTTFISPDNLAKPSADPASTPVFGMWSPGLTQRPGTEPLPPTARTEIRDLFAALWRSEADPVVRSAGRALSRRFFFDP